MRTAVTLLATLVLLATAFGVPAQANHATVFVLSPVANKDWRFTSGAGHPAGYLSTARDVAGAVPGAWTSDEDVKFNVTTSGTNVQGWVEQATTNCATGGPDKFVKLQLWLDGEFYGKVAYVHLRTLNVSPNTWITPGTLLGKIQNQPSSHQGETCWTGIHIHMEESSGQWLNVPVGQVQPYSQWVAAFTGTGINRLMKTPQQLADTQKRSPVTR